MKKSMVIKESILYSVLFCALGLSLSVFYTFDKKQYFGLEFMWWQYVIGSVITICWTTVWRITVHDVDKKIKFAHITHKGFWVIVYISLVGYTLTFVFSETGHVTTVFIACTTFIACINVRDNIKLEKQVKELSEWKKKMESKI